MTKLVPKNKTSVEGLTSILLSTLDEAIFFNELSKFFMNNVFSDRVLVYQVLNDNSARLVSKSGKKVEGGKKALPGKGSVGHVVRTKRPYFSNSVSKDPLFSSDDSEGVNAELCVPVNCAGSVIGTIHLQILSSDKLYSKDDITEVLDILKGIERPLANMNMYLSAKYLNESLVKQVEAKERELEERRTGGVNLSHSKVETSSIIGKSTIITRVIKMADRIATTDSNFLMQGKTGTGKELMAKRVHCLSSRRDHVFLGLDCSLYDEKQLEIELFGEEQVLENGTISIRQGIVETSDGGTLFITNIEKLSLSLQVKLKDFLAEKIAFRVGGQVPYRSQIRVIASTSSDIFNLVGEGNFREDLYYSIGSIILKIPNLSDRVDDIEILSTHFLNLGRSINEQKSLSPGVLKGLKDYSWPGNIRELRSAMERAYILSEGKIVERDHLSENILNATVENNDNIDDGHYRFAEMTLDELEQKHICQTLELLAGNKTRTAKTLGITVKTLYNKLHSYGMIATKEA